MNFNNEMLEHMADTARIGLSEGEKEELLSTIQEIISIADGIIDADTSGLEPMEHVTTLKNVFREDKVDEPYTREIILSNASETNEGCFSVPKIVE
ncbi:MAG: Asp-tRNA(Asn)/Glu-tRNA(Gln) amidotransferase subunit GatC [Clostridiaceae bacterium]|nr:Asp-tRNA(Asn)/Glu-tRNA(Gln) amidotransferase subunit GatC [Clostridiaceae bacterium]